MISSLLDIINEHLLHVIATNTNTKLLISLTAILTKGVSQVIVEWRRQFSMFIFVGVVVESVGGVEEWSTFSLILVLPKQVVCVVSNFFVQRPVVWETIALGESEARLRRGVVNGCVVFVGHILLNNKNFYFIYFKSTKYTTFLTQFLLYSTAFN